MSRGGLPGDPSSRLRRVVSRRRLPSFDAVVDDGDDDDGRASASSSHRPIVIGYAHDPGSGKAERAIRDGCDVIIWSFLHLELVGEDVPKELEARGEVYLPRLRFAAINLKMLRLIVRSHHG